MSVMQNTLDVILTILGNLSIGSLVWGFYKYMTSGGDPGDSKAAKDSIIYAATGLIVWVLALSFSKVVLPKIGSFSNLPSSISPVDIAVITGGFWISVGFVAAGLRWLRRLPRWIAVISACCIPRSEQQAYIDEIWAALLGEVSLAKRTQMSITAVMAAPRLGWFARKRRRREKAELLRLA